METGLPWQGSSAAEAAMREHFSGEEGTKAVEQQVCSRPLSPPGFAGGKICWSLCAREVLRREGQGLTMSTS